MTLPVTPNPAQPVPLNDLLDEILARANAATSGPWTFKKQWGPYSWQGAILHDLPGVYNSEVLQLPTGTPELNANGAFIAAARSDLPRVVAALRQSITDADSGEWSHLTKEKIARILIAPADSVQDGNAAHSPPDKTKS